MFRVWEWEYSLAFALKAQASRNYKTKG